MAAREISIGTEIGNKRVEGFRTVCHRRRYLVTYLCCGKRGEVCRETLVRKQSRNSCDSCASSWRKTRGQWKIKPWRA